MSNNQSSRPVEAANFEDRYTPTLWDYLKANYKLVLIGLGLLIAGAVIGRMFPPFVLDSDFWRDFFTGPPIAGLFAVIAAFVAFSTARSGNRTARKHAEEEEWWNRAEWGIGLALSKEEQEKLVRLKAISVLLDGADKREDALIREVAEEILLHNTAVDNSTQKDENLLNRPQDGEDHGQEH